MMNATNATVCTGIEPNNDVSGLGMRASLYTLCLGGHILNFIIKVLSTREASAKFEQSYRDALSVQGTALLCTAWYQSIQNRLTLFHAVVIFHLLGLLGVNLASHISSKGASKFQDFVNKLLAYFAAFFYIAFNMYVWIRDPDFGSQPECNETVVYVLFGQSVKATYDAFRYLILGNTCLIAAFTLAYFLAELILCCCCPCWRWLGMSRANRAKSPVNNDDDNQREPLPYLGDDNAVAELGPDQWGRAIMVVMSYTGFSIYAIVSLEQIISRNQVSEEENEWTFGQILALFLLLGPVLDFVDAMAEAWNKTERTNNAAYRDGGTASYDNSE